MGDNYLHQPANRANLPVGRCNFADSNCNLRPGPEQIAPRRRNGGGALDRMRKRVPGDCCVAASTERVHARGEAVFEDNARGSECDICQKSTRTLQEY